MIQFHCRLIFILCCLSFSLHPKAEVEQLKRGHLYLPSSQQPNPLFSIGQNVLDQNHVQVFVSTNQASASGQNYLTITPSLLYGITDEVSLLVSMPFRYQANNQQISTGAGDLVAEVEYAFYTQKSPTNTLQATVLANISIPTGSEKANPPLGLGSPSFALGTTICNTTPGWYYFGDFSAQITTTYKNIKAGNQYQMAAGLGRNISGSPRWITTALVEIVGFFTETDTIQNFADKNSGGTVIYIAPSLWASTNTLLMQFGIGIPIYQKLNGQQQKIDYLLAANLGFTFE